MKNAISLAWALMILLSSLYPSNVGALPCSDGFPVFSISNGTLEVPCVAFEGRCFRVTMGIKDDAISLVSLQPTGQDLPQAGSPEGNFVGEIDLKDMALSIPQIRVRYSGGTLSSEAFDVRFKFFLEDDTVRFEVDQVRPVEPVDNCTLVSTGSSSENSGNSESVSNPPASSGYTGVENDQYIVIAYNDLGMHCMNGDHSLLSILPPYNTLVAQVIRRGREPKVITKGIVVEYRMLQNDMCVGTNFWDYAGELFGLDVPFCQGLTGNGVSGEMELRGERFFAEGLPVTPFDNSGTFNPYPMAEVTVKDASTGAIISSTQTVVPISYEMNCHKCHGGSGGSITMENILKKHDEEEGTDLLSNTPVLCQECHSDPALDSAGKEGVPNFSLAMHGRHAKLSTQPSCYDCHPGPETKCLRTAIEGMDRCEGCHGGLEQMAQGLRAGRTPWLEEPKCSNCHSGKDMDTGSNLYRNARGHGGIYCETCHYEPHAWWPSLLDKDNEQAIRLQGHAGPLGENGCIACHTEVPDDDEGPHGMGGSGREDDDDD